MTQGELRGAAGVPGSETEDRPSPGHVAGVGVVFHGLVSIGGGGRLQDTRCVVGVCLPVSYI